MEVFPQYVKNGIWFQYNLSIKKEYLAITQNLINTIQDSLILPKFFFWLFPKIVLVSFLIFYL